MPTRNIDQIFDLTKNALIAHGAAQWQADEVAKATAHSEAYGNVICGLQYVESYCIQLASGRVDGRADPIVTKPRASAVLSDAQLGFAQPAFAKGLETACNVARETGIALYSVSNSHTCTSLGYFTEQIAAHGLIGWDSRTHHLWLRHLGVNHAL